MRGLGASSSAMEGKRMDAVSRRNLLMGTAAVTVGATVAGSLVLAGTAQAAENPAFPKASSPNYPTTVDTGHGMVIFGPGPGLRLHHKWQSVAGGPWSSWVPVPIADHVLGSAPVAVGNVHGGLSVFARTSGGDLLHAWQNQRDGAWSSGSLGNGVAGNPSAVVNPHGGMSVFFQGGNGNTMMVRQDAENEQPGQGWTAWQDLGPGGTGQPMAFIGASGGVVLFVRTPNGRVLHKWQNYVGGPWLPSQTTWADMGGTLTADPVTVLSPNGGLSLFGRSHEEFLSHAWQAQPGGAWDLGWIRMSFGPILGRPAVVVAPHGGMHVFAWGKFGDVLHWWQDGFSGQWHEGNIGGGPVVSQPSAVVNPSGRISVFARLDGSRILHKWQRDPNPSSAWDEVVWQDQLN
jgi:hypothetical protein